MTPVEAARDLSLQEREHNGSTSITLVYGELGPHAVLRLFQKIQQFQANENHSSTFLDIGSGTGKMLMAASLLLQGCTSAVGIELLQSLHEAALINVQLLNSLSHSSTVVECIHGDALSPQTLSLEKWNDIDVVFCNATMFDEKMMRAMSRLPFKQDTLFITSTNKLDDARWNQVDEFVLDGGNWGSSTKIFMYQRRDKKETMIRVMAKKMSSVR